MSFDKTMHSLYQKAMKLSINDQSKIVLMSDCHRGDGSGADNFLKNQNLFIGALTYYYNENYTYIELGDGDEMWENKKFDDIVQSHNAALAIMRMFYLKGRLYIVFGNHDMVKKKMKWVKKYLFSYLEGIHNVRTSLFEDVIVHESIVLCDIQKGYEIFLLHGHQVDFLNYDLWKLARFLVRYVWRPLELVGIKDPGSPQKNQTKKIKVEKKLSNWARKENIMLIAGHTHRWAFPEIGEPMYFNDGCCVYPTFITAIEIVQGTISLVKWNVRTKSDGTLYVKRERIEGPVSIENYFKALA